MAVRLLTRLCLLIGLLTLASIAVAESANRQAYTARDSLARLADPSPDALACLDGCSWPLATFDVSLEPTPDADYDWLVRFPSPIASGDAANDRVVLEWYAARDALGQPRRAPAVVVVHETGSQMLAGRLYARGLRAKGVHALMVQLPYYGLRRGEGIPAGASAIALFRQGVADIRRARDAVAVLPLIDVDNINLQGTSLGGIAAALAGSLDGAFDRTFLTLAGGDLFELVKNGEREAGMFHRRLLQMGYSEREIEALLWQIEPTRIVHRLEPTTTWLYSARDDHVIPERHSAALAAAARLPAEHQLVYEGNHYTVFFYFPKFLDHMVAQIVAP